MKLICKRGATGVVLRVKIGDSTSLTNGGKTGLTANSAGLVISTIADVEAAATAYSAAAGTIESIATLGTFAAPTVRKCRFREVDATNHPGIYEIQLAAARWGVSNARSLIVTVSGAAGASAVDAEVQLSGVDVDDAVRGGLSALPAVASGGDGGLLTTGVGANQVQVSGDGALARVLSVAACQDLLEADRVIDTSVVPWALVLIKKGSGSLGQNGTVELLRQKLYDASGNPVTNANTVLGRSIT